MAQADENTSYGFLPWYRTGLASAIDAQPEGDRGQVTIEVAAKIDGADAPVQKNIRLVGARDLIGIDPLAVVRVDPRPFANDVEPNYVAAIEFFDEDYIWRYSPRAPEGEGGNRLLPWIALIVLEDGEFTWTDQAGTLPRAITVKDSKLLPPADQLWAWGHTHLSEISVSEPVSPDVQRATAAQLAAKPAFGCSRLLAPRRLRPNKSYHAFLVPTFEAGRARGLVGSVPANRLMSWDGSGSVDLPVYYEWTFATGENGDFEQLATRLRACHPDQSLGRRPMDVSQPLPGMNVPTIQNSETPPRAVLDLEGALQVRASDAVWSKAPFQQWLASFINLSNAWPIKADHTTDSDAAGSAGALLRGISLPVILPPSYGRWHANVDTLDSPQSDSRWLEQLNLDPRYRVAAAFGTLVVQRNQEDFAARAWQQFGELRKANALRNRAQLFREILTAIEDKHLSKLADTKLLTTTALAHPRIVVAEQKVTVRGLISSSALPLAATQPAMRRLLRPGGRIAARFDMPGRALDNVIGATASIKATVATAWQQPRSRLTLSTDVPPDVGPPVQTVPPDVIAPIGGITPIGAIHAIGVARLAPAASGVAHLASPQVMQLPQTSTVSEVATPIQTLPSSQTSISKERIVTGVVLADKFTPASIGSVSTNLNWQPVAENARARVRQEDLAPATADANFSFAAWNLRQAMLNTTELLTADAEQPEAPQALDVGGTAARVRSALKAKTSVEERVSRMMVLPSWWNQAQYDPLETIMPYPSFDDATYRYLKSISVDYVVPNLSKLPNNSVTLLECNWPFIESFLVGMNHEMARELLWRGYPTDQRGSFFRQFWDVAGVPGALDADGRVVEWRHDIQPIHGWKLNGNLTPLGNNRPAGDRMKKNLVLVIKGDLLRRYPTTHVYAIRAEKNPSDPAQRPEDFRHSTRRPASESAAQEPSFTAQFDGDVYGFGFDLTADQARGSDSDQGWYFVLEERFGEPRFGLDEPEGGAIPSSAATKATDVSWAHLVTTPEEYNALEVIDLSRHKLGAPVDLGVGDPDPNARDAAWGSDAADMAAILLQLPFRVYFHARDMLDENRRPDLGAAGAVAWASARPLPPTSTPSPP